jgi:hypothetical protein
MHTKFNSENLKEREIKHNTKCSDDIRCISWGIQRLLSGGFCELAFMTAGPKLNPFQNLGTLSICYRQYCYMLGFLGGMTCAPWWHFHSDVIVPVVEQWVILHFHSNATVCWHNNGFVSQHSRIITMDMEV